MAKDVVMLEWIFTPKNYFEEVFTLDDEYNIIIGEGIVEASIDPLIYTSGNKIRDYLHQKVETIFFGKQLFNHTPFTLSKSTMYRLHSNGRRDATVFLEAIATLAITASINIITKDKDGNIISDSRRDRIEMTNKFATLVAKHNQDPLLKALLHSYHAAVNDSTDELVHLYEIRDALASAFDSETKVCTFLGIKKSDWSRLGQLANDEPLTQSRHRGKKALDLRSATKEELEEARDIAKRFIDAYLNYLEKKGES